MSNSIRALATQSLHPWRATVRTVFAWIVGLSASWGLVVQAAGLNPDWQWVTVAGAITAGVTRVLAVPAVDALLNRYFPWLSATPKA